MKRIAPELTVGITLSGGGVRGAAHIGLIRALLEAGIVPTRIVGVSAGAIVGALYAAGLSPDEMMERVHATSLRRIIKVGLPTTGLTTLEYLKERLREIIPENSFEGLKYPLFVGMTNLNTGQLEIKSEGPLHDIVAASCSIPFVFKPEVIDGDHFVDGGVIKNMPVDPLLNETDFIIGSNLMPYGLLPPADTGTVINIVWRVFDLSIMANTLPSTEVCDIVIEPSQLNAYHIFSITKLQDLHNLGYEHTKQRMPEIVDALRMKQELLQEMKSIS